MGALGSGGGGRRKSEFKSTLLLGLLGSAVVDAAMTVMAGVAGLTGVSGSARTQQHTLEYRSEMKPPIFTIYFHQKY